MRSARSSPAFLDRRVSRSSACRDESARDAAKRSAQGVFPRAARTSSRRRRPRSRRRRCRVLRAASSRTGSRSSSAGTTFATPAGRPSMRSRSRRQTDSPTSTKPAGEASTSTGLAHSLFLFLSAGVDVFEEAAKLRAARRLWARILHERYGVPAEDRRDQHLRLHARRRTDRAGASEQRRPGRLRDARGGARRRADDRDILLRRGARAAHLPPPRTWRYGHSRSPPTSRARRASPIRSAARTTSRRSPTPSSSRSSRACSRSSRPAARFPRSSRG